MNRRSVVATLVASAALLTLAPARALAAGETGEGAKFYLQYKAAFAKAKAIEEILPYMAKKRAAEIESTPKDDRAKMFEMIRMMDVRDVKIAKETRTENGITLGVTGTGGLGDGPTKGTITLVREDGQLKVDKESWKN